MRRHLSEQVFPAGITAAQQRPIVDEQQIPICKYFQMYDNDNVITKSNDKYA